MWSANVAAAEGSKIDPMHQFLIEPVAGSHWVVGGYDLSFTNSALWMVVTLASLADAVLDAVERGPHGRRNHPTPDHILPLFAALGAGGAGATGERLHHSFTYGVLAMDAYAFH